MRLLRLDLARFGLFTDVSLDLSAPGTHVLLGHNEAGKTTAMAAIEQLLYGIPVRTSHAFLHEMRDLRLGALLADDEVEAIQGRAAWMVKERRFPTDPTGRRYPWPLV